MNNPTPVKASTEAEVCYAVRRKGTSDLPCPFRTLEEARRSAEDKGARWEVVELRVRILAEACTT